jgi:hypothetical protein
VSSSSSLPLSAAPVGVRPVTLATGMVPPHLTGLYGEVNSRSVEVRGSMGIASSGSGGFSVPSIQVSRLRLPPVLCSVPSLNRLLMGLMPDSPACSVAAVCTYLVARLAGRGQLGRMRRLSRVAMPHIILILSCESLQWYPTLRIHHPFAWNSRRM